MAVESHSRRVSRYSALPTAPAAAGRLTVRGHVNILTGYGQLLVGLVRELQSRGVPVCVVPLGEVWEGFGFTIPDDIRAVMASASPDEWELLLAPPPHKGLPGKSTVHFTMWESGRLNPGYAEALNVKRAVIVPSRWCQETFDAGYVLAPLYHCPLPVDTELYRPVVDRRCARGPVTFGCSGRVAHGGLRKGLEQCVDAFTRAFPDEQDVCLEVKVFPDCDFPEFTDPRVTVIREAWTDAQMAAWYRRLTAFVSCAAAEGFGLQPLQALASGVPVLATDATGHREYLTEEVGYCVRSTLVRAELAAPGNPYYVGYWSLPDLAHVSERMREVYHAPDEARRRGRAGVATAQRFAWEHFGNRLLTILKECGMLSVK